MKFGLKSIRDVSDLKGKKVILRLDLNEPMKGGVIEDDFRIIKDLPVLNFLREQGAISLVLSHLDAKGESLQKEAEYLNNKFPTTFIKDLFSDEAQQKIESAENGAVIVFENIRQYPEEENNDEDFSKKIAALGDLYVNDAFPVSHRKHASIVGVPKFLPHYAGLQLEEEIKHLSLADNPERPLLFILGGAKFHTKFPLIQKFMVKADKSFVAGALANDFFKAKGWETGRSLVSDVFVDPALLESDKLVLPIDLVVQNDQGVSIKLASEVNKDDKISDSGPRTMEALEGLIKEAKLIIWNGPLGYYEDGFNQPTLDLAKMISESAATTIIGGGDTIAAIETLGLQDKFTFISTGGGAMLDFLLNDTLPGIEALK